MAAAAGVVLSVLVWRAFAEDLSDVTATEEDDCP